MFSEDGSLTDYTHTIDKEYYIINPSNPTTTERRDYFMEGESGACYA